MAREHGSARNDRLIDILQEEDQQNKEYDMPVFNEITILQDDVIVESTPRKTEKHIDTKSQRLN